MERSDCIVRCNPGEDLRSLVRSKPPHPIASRSTSRRRGEVNRACGSPCASIEVIATTCLRPMASSPRAQQAALLATPVTLLLGLALVVQLLALGDRELHLGPAALVEIEFERNQRHAFTIDRAEQLVDLLAMQQQLARTLWFVIEAIGLQVFGNVGVDQPDLAV